MSERTLRALLALTAATGVLVSAYLTYLELFVIGAACQWCVASAILIAACLLLCILRLAHTPGL